MKAAWSWKVILIGLALEVVISVAAFFAKVTESCTRCGGGSTIELAIAAAGFVAYLVLLGIGLWAGPRAILFVGILVGFAVHAALVFSMISTGAFCWICAIAAGVSLVLFAMSVLYDRFNLVRATIVLPLGAIVIQIVTVVWGIAQPPIPERSAIASEARSMGMSAEVRIVVFEDPGCPYCQTLEREILPRIEKEFGSRLRIIRRAGSDMPGIVLPTIVVVGAGEEVFEGLPSHSLLREAVLRAFKSIEVKHVSTSLLSNP